MRTFLDMQGKYSKYASFLLSAFGKSNIYVCWTANKSFLRHFLLHIYLFRGDSLKQLFFRKSKQKAHYDMFIIFRNQVKYNKMKAKASYYENAEIIYLKIKMTHLNYGKFLKIWVDLINLKIRRKTLD